MISRQALISIVTRFCNGDYDDDEASAVMDSLYEELPHSQISDLIFNDDVIFGKFMNLTPEQIVDEAFRLQAEHDSKE